MSWSLALWAAQTPGHFRPALITSGPQSKQFLCSNIPQKLSKHTNSKSLCFVLPILSHRNFSKGSCPQYTLASTVLALLMVWNAPTFGNCACNHVSNGNFLLICMPYSTWQIMKLIFYNYTAERRPRVPRMPFWSPNRTWPTEWVETNVQFKEPWGITHHCFWESFTRSL